MFYSYTVVNNKLTVCCLKAGRVVQFCALVYEGRIFTQVHSFGMLIIIFSLNNWDVAIGIVADENYNNMILK